MASGTGMNLNNTLLQQAANGNLASAAANGGSSSDSAAALATFAKNGRLKLLVDEGDQLKKMNIAVISIFFEEKDIIFYYNPKSKKVEVLLTNEPENYKKIASTYLTGITEDGLTALKRKLIEEHRAKYKLPKLNDDDLEKVALSGEEKKAYENFVRTIEEIKAGTNPTSPILAMQKFESDLLSVSDSKAEEPKIVMPKIIRSEELTGPGGESLKDIASKKHPYLNEKYLKVDSSMNAAGPFVTNAEHTKTYFASEGLEGFLSKLRKEGSLPAFVAGAINANKAELDKYLDLKTKQVESRQAAINSFSKTLTSFDPKKLLSGMAILAVVGPIGLVFFIPFIVNFALKVHNFMQANKGINTIEAAIKKIEEGNTNLAAILTFNPTNPNNSTTQNTTNTTSATHQNPAELLENLTTNKEDKENKLVKPAKDEENKLDAEVDKKEKTATDSTTTIEPAPDSNTDDENNKATVTQVNKTTGDNPNPHSKMETSPTRNLNYAMKKKEFEQPDPNNKGYNPIIYTGDLPSYESLGKVKKSTSTDSDDELIKSHHPSLPTTHRRRT